MFERFTDRARRVVVLAQEEARLLNVNIIGSDHLLLGLIHEGEGVAAGVLADLGVTLDAARAKAVNGNDQPSGHIPFTPEVKRMLEHSLREALQLGHNYIGTEHLLLAVVSDFGSTAQEILAALGVDDDTVRKAVKAKLVGYATRPTLPSEAERIASQVRAMETEITELRDENEQLRRIVGSDDPLSSSVTRILEAWLEDRRGT